MKKLFKVLIFLLLVGISIALLFIGNGYNMYKETIEAMPLEEKVEEIRAKENYAEFSELPQMYVKAVISVEDKRFFKHNGIDIIAIGRAAINDIKAMSYMEGGSTITQQLAKNMYFTILLAGIPNAPSVYAPTKNPDLAKQRQRQVMDKMIENGYLTEEEANEILKQEEWIHVLIVAEAVSTKTSILFREGTTKNSGSPFVF